MWAGGGNSILFASSFFFLTATKKSDAGLEEERVPDENGKQTGSDQQTKDDEGKPEDVAKAEHKDNTTKQNIGAGKGKGEVGKQDGEGGGVRQRKGPSGSGKVGITHLPS